MADDILKPTEVVTAFLEHEGRILLVKRSSKVSTYQDSWAAISGYLEDPTPLMQARREIREETSLPDDEVHLITEGEVMRIPAPELGKLWVVYPFLFRIDNPEHIRLDWENVDSRWVELDKIRDFPSVPKLEEVLQTCLK